MGWIWPEQMSGYSVGKKLGEGKYGTVRLAVRKSDDVKFAIKLIKKERIKTEGDWTRIRRETEVLTNLDHPHIINLQEVFETDKMMCLVMDYAAGGDLFDYILTKPAKRLSPGEAFPMFRQMVSAMDYCHSRFVVHRDLKPENILLTPDKKVKIGDFGFARTFSPGTPLETACGSFAYASPEVITGQKYLGPSADIWSLGCILYAMLCGGLPFKGNNNYESLQRIKEGRFIDSPHLLNDDTRAFFRKIFHPYPSRRITIREIAKHKVIWQDKPLLAMLIRPFANMVQHPYHAKIETTESNTTNRLSRRSFSESEMDPTQEAANETTKPELAFSPLATLTPIPPIIEEKKEESQEDRLAVLFETRKKGHKRTRSTHEDCHKMELKPRQLFD